MRNVLAILFAPFFGLYVLAILASAPCVRGARRCWHDYFRAGPSLSCDAERAQSAPNFQRVNRKKSGLRGSEDA